MPPRQSIPRIRVEFLDGSPRTLSPSSTLDITDILSQVKRWPKLLAEDFAFDKADNALYLEDGYLEEVPPFPMERRPTLFFLNSHRMRLLLPTRRLTFELGEYCGDEEDTRPLVTAPTIPRMKLIMKEQLYVRKWVDALTSNNPPKHIPWTCEKPATKRKSIAECSVHPPDTVNSSAERRKTVQGRLRVIDTNKPLVNTDQVVHSGVFSPTRTSAESHASTSRVLPNPADVDSGTFRGELNLSHTPPRSVRTSQASSTPTPRSSRSKIGTVPTTPDAPLAARRGKSLGGLTLKECVIEQLEYPDIPTAFRGSPSVWSPRFDASPVPFYTDHQSMILDLRSKCAALENGTHAYVQEPLSPQEGVSLTSPGSDEWAFARGLATFDDDYSGWSDRQVPREIITDISIFLPIDSSTPAKVPLTARSKCIPRSDLAPPLQSSIPPASGPPDLPLPPRPAIVSPLTPPYVRGILKKSKSVRFEDMITKESQDNTPPVAPPPQPPSGSPPPSLLAVPSVRSCTPMPNAAKPSSGLAPAKEVPVLSETTQEKKSVPRSRLPPKRIKVYGNIEPKHPEVGHSPETSKPTSTVTPVERPCRNLHGKENSKPAAVPQSSNETLVYR
ncbi:hypothetical protein JVU11DRAFT_6458 [Chiua virens]|nr:hypothetical protein JVU11DRAFT_6458 [Chiua virens]